MEEKPQQLSAATGTCVKPWPVCDPGKIRSLTPCTEASPNLFPCRSTGLPRHYFDVFLGRQIGKTLSRSALGTGGSGLGVSAGCHQPPPGTPQVAQRGPLPPEPPLGWDPGDAGETPDPEPQNPAGHRRAGCIRSKIRVPLRSRSGCWLRIAAARCGAAPPAAPGVPQRNPGLSLGPPSNSAPRRRHRACSAPRDAGGCGERGCGAGAAKSLVRALPVPQNQAGIQIFPKSPFPSGGKQGTDRSRISGSGTLLNPLSAFPERGAEGESGLRGSGHRPPEHRQLPTEPPR